MTRVGSWGLRGAVAIALLYMLLPLVIVVGASFSATGYLTFPPRGASLQWYGAFIRAPGWLDSIALSLKLAAAATSVSLLIGIPIALAISRSTGVVARALAAGLLSPLIIPQIVLGVGLLQALGTFRAERTFLGILVAHVIITFPFIVRSVIASLAEFDVSLEEAAADLGARPLTRFFTVTLPLIQPGVVAGGLFAFVISWTNVEVTMFQTTSALNPLPVKIMNYVAYNVDPMIAAVSATSIYIGIIALALIDATIGIERFAGRASPE